MARGYPGAFGRKSNALYIWLPLSVLFVLPFIDPRRPLRLRHLDLLVLSFFSVSLAFFNHGHIDVSVPLVYPPLVYLLGACCSAGRRRGTRLDPLRLLVPVSWLAVATVFLVGFRVGLNVTDSNVIDVGYAGVIGADRLLHGKALYGHFPRDNEHGDTYGPVNYEAYVPAVAIARLERALGRPAGRAHRLGVLRPALPGAAVPARPARARADARGRARLRVGGLPVHAVRAEQRHQRQPRRRAADRGPAGRLAAGRARRPDRAGRPDQVRAARARAADGNPWARRDGVTGPSTPRSGLPRFALGFGIAAALAFVPVCSDRRPGSSMTRTLDYQASRGSPFSVWGLYGGLASRVQTAVQVGALLLACWPR